MGSLKDMRDATDFIKNHQIVPIVSHVLDGLDSCIEGFSLLERGDHFGKVILRVSGTRRFENARL
jgi:NADPH-dependent curcumin reductase CurA